MEAVLMSAINHDNIVRTFKVGWGNGAGERVGEACCSPPLEIHTCTPLRPPSAPPHPHYPHTSPPQVIAHQGEQVDPELAALEKQLLKGHVPGTSKDLDLGVPSFEWHIIMEFCDRGSLSRALSSFM